MKPHCCIYCKHFPKKGVTALTPNECSETIEKYLSGDADIIFNINYCESYESIEEPENLARGIDYDVQLQS